MPFENHCHLHSQIKTEKLFNINNSPLRGGGFFIKYPTFLVDPFSFPRISKQSYFVFLMEAVFPSFKHFNFLWALSQLFIPAHSAVLSGY